MKLLEDQLFPLVQAELSVLVDVLHQPDLLFPAGTEERKKCEGGGFISRFDILLLSFEPAHDKTNKITYAASEDSDQPGHPPSLIRVFTVPHG